MKDRIIEMLENGDEVKLVCIDRDAFVDSDPEFYKRNSLMSRFDYLVVNKASKLDCLMVSSPYMGYEFALLDSELKYFKIKESTPTFNDLIDVAVQAWKDGCLKVLELEKGIVDQIFTVIDGIAYAWYDGDYDYSRALDIIKSLYTETFVIESEGDIERVKVGALIELSNGNSDRAMLTDKYSGQSMVQFSENKHWGAVGLFILKGATVTQKRGDS